MTQVFYLLKLGPPAGCSPSPWSSVGSCIPSLIAIWQGLPVPEQPRLVWAGQGEALIAPPTQLEPRNLQLWDLALIVRYPKDSSYSDSARVENLGQFVDMFHTEIEDLPGDFHTQAPVLSTAKLDVPKNHPLPGYSRIRKMYEQSPKAHIPIHMINLLYFAPQTGKQQYQEYLEACAPALGMRGASVAFNGRILTRAEDKTTLHWDSLLIGTYPDKHTFISCITDRHYMEAFKIREAALVDTLLLATVPIDLMPYNKLVQAKL